METHLMLGRVDVYIHLMGSISRYSTNAGC